MRQTTHPFSDEPVGFFVAGSLRGSATIVPVQFDFLGRVLCKLICHNLFCLIMEQECLGIVPVFRKDEPQDDERNILRIS